jgi:hypothetical protein
MVLVFARKHNSSGQEVSRIPVNRTLNGGVSGMKERWMMVSATAKERW